MRSAVLVLIIVARSLAIVLYTLVKIVLVFHWTTLHDIGAAIADEWRAAADAGRDDWQR